MDNVPAALADEVRTQLDSIYPGLKNDLDQAGDWPGGIKAFVLNQAYSLFLRNMLSDKVISAFRQALNDQNLLPVYTQDFTNDADGLIAANAARSEWLQAGAKRSVLTQTKANWVLVTTWS